jgi:hypothetical protein
MTSLDDAVTVSTSLDIEWAELGRYFGEQLASPQQAEFLMGVYESIADMQLAYIGSEPIFRPDRREVAQVFEDLAAHIRGDGS